MVLPGAACAFDRFGFFCVVSDLIPESLLSLFPACRVDDTLFLVLRFFGLIFFFRCSYSSSFFNLLWISIIGLVWNPEITDMLQCSKASETQKHPFDWKLNLYRVQQLKNEHSEAKQTTPGFPKRKEALKSDMHPCLAALCTLKSQWDIDL